MSDMRLPTFLKNMQSLGECSDTLCNNEVAEKMYIEDETGEILDTEYEEDKEMDFNLDEEDTLILINKIGVDGKIQDVLFAISGKEADNNLDGKLKEFLNLSDDYKISIESDEVVYRVIINKVENCNGIDIDFSSKLLLGKKVIKLMSRR